MQVSTGCCVHGGAQRGSRCQYFISSHAGEEAEGGCRLAACFGEAQGAAERGLSNVRMGGGRLLCCLLAPGGGAWLCPRGVPGLLLAEHKVLMAPALQISAWRCWTFSKAA